MVVADGVGGWASHGIDPGVFPKQLVADFKKLFDFNNSQNLLDMLKTCIRLNPNEGSSTFCAVKFDSSNENLIETINLGDSGYLILRPDSEELSIIFRSKEQTHRFNFPFQVGSVGDNPNEADQFQH